MQLGATAVLLLWTVSECFNNERSDYKVWNVRRLDSSSVR